MGGCVGAVQMIYLKLILLLPLALVALINLALLTVCLWVAKKVM